MDEDQGSFGSAGSAASSEEVPAALLAAWRAAEERLYPMIMVIPEDYERVVRLVGETTVELQLACRDVAALVAEAPRVPDRVRRLAGDNGFGDGFDFALIGAAACLMRYRQVEAEVGREQRVRQIEVSLGEGASWVTLVQGAPPTTWPPLPSTTLEMHLATGRALEETISMDIATGAATFTLRELPLDPRTGERADRQGAPAREQEFHDLQEWRAAAAARRGEIELGD